MKKFNDKKIAEKITSTILSILLFSNIIIGLAGLIGISAVIATSKQVYSVNMVPLTPIYKLSNDFSMIRVDMRELLLSTGDNTATISSINASFSDIDRQLTAYGKRLSTKEEKSNFQRIQKDVTDYKTLKDNLVNYVNLGMKDQARALLKGKITADMTAAVSKAFSINTAQAEQRDSANTVVFICAFAVILALSAVSVIFSFLRGRRIANGISRPIEKMAGAANSIADGNLDVDVTVDAKDETGALAEAFKKIIQSLTFLREDAGMLIREAEDGRLDTRADLTRHSGDYRKIVNGMNTMLDTVMAPLNVASGYIDKLADGEKQDDIENSYKGYYAALIDNLNRVGHSINILIEESSRLAAAGLEGQLDVRGDESRLKGNYAEIIRGVNQMFDAIKEPLDASAIFIRKMARGDDLEVLENPYKGYYAKIVENLNAVRSSLYVLLKESEKLAEAGLGGNLSVRGDTSKLQGGYLKIISGFNRAFEGIEAPLNEAHSVLGKMAVNDYTAKMSENWSGMLDDLSNSINSVRGELLNVQEVFEKLAQGDISPLETYKAVGKRSENDKLLPAGVKMMQSIHDLIEDSNLLAASAFEGKLDTRCDESRFEGGYHQIIGGMNRMMEAVAAPIEESSQVLRELADGDLTSEMTGQYKGEYNRIKTSLNHAIESFSKVINEIMVSASQVSVGSRQVSDGSQSLSQGTTEQASSVEQLTSSVSEIAAKTRQNASNASQASSLTAEAEAEAAEGNRQMQNMLVAMREINESSSGISKIIKTIDDISFQTNILALNAAVEAARAGQYGKGFSVVAEEVRNLAAKSSEAAKETTALIEDSFKKVTAGTKIADETARKLSEISQKVGKSAVLVSDIASASNEQATAIAEIDKGLGLVSTVVQTNSATAEESAASSEELSGQANMLEQIVGKFKVNNDQNIPSNPGTGRFRAARPDDRPVPSASKPGISLDGEFGKY